MNLIDLLSSIHIPCDDSRTILGMSDDSRDIQKDWLFIARSGVYKHGKDYIDYALKKGAVVLQEGSSRNANIYECDNIEQVLPILLDTFYERPWQNLCMIGITGTNGKSSVTDILRQLLKRNEHQVMTVGTGAISYHDKVIDISNTTPSIFVLQQYFLLAKEIGIDTIIMEVSSHAIDQNRIRGIFYDFIIYTNITQDHLDYHVTKTHYQYTKFKIRNALKEDGVIIINNDDHNLQPLYSLSNSKMITCGCGQAHFPIRNIRLNEQMSYFQIHAYEFCMPLLSMVNVYNVSEALIVCRCLHIAYHKLQEDLKYLKPVAGRLQCLHDTKPTIWIDYAHTFNAVKNIIDFANSIKKGKLIFIVGCGGEREQEKRQMIGNYAENHCDLAIFTTDNSRHEAPYDILKEMLPEHHEHVQVIENRWFAIKHAIKNATNSDIIVIAGKGNEKTQSFMGKDYAFHDETCVYEILKREELF